jgi:hypothetical protein
MIEIIVVVILTLALLNYIEVKFNDDEAFTGLIGTQFAFGISYIIFKLVWNISPYWLILYFAPLVLIIAVYHLENFSKTKIENKEKILAQYIESQTVYHLNQFKDSENKPIKIIEYYYTHKNFHKCNVIDFSDIKLILSYKQYFKDDSEVYHNLVAHNIGLQKAKQIIGE